ncbi:dihydroneopterin aldolase [Gardnerella vaginalis]|uniref:dihydroneopterin aldolase n=1 Tax=Gardnerella vaginalis TaxID=2702 RepID=UPI000C795FD7|nr:dihydroneopterin aldolase [Gardnerella vaginalis]MDK7259503.1 dihydroneopterin aldolase [Gardnerella vaginalis]MDK8776417.1 dihydroneopterin aldolase [Gardnerella vaginalis]NSX29736.1 dihydroneopterin aldolase [Gardnerella vaginalis]PKZ46818.1 dihydroneopterin aldolase [Gardnerella vaginalis]
MDTIKLSGIKPSDTDAFIGLYTRLSVDAVLSLDLRAAVAGDSTQTVDIAQISKRLSRVLDSCVQDDDIAKNSSICLELTAGRLLDSAMKSWLVKQAEITVNAQFKADFNDASYDLPNADGVSITIRRVADDVETSQIFGLANPTDASLFAAEQKEKLQDETSRDESKDKSQATSDSNSSLDSVYSQSGYNPIITTAVVSMQGEKSESTRFAMLDVITSLEQSKEPLSTQLDGVSALYQVSSDRGEEYSAIIVVSSTMVEDDLARKIKEMQISQEQNLRLRILGTRQYGSDSSNTKTMDSDRLDSPLNAAQLEPWIQIEPDASIDGEPLAYKLAFAPDAARVGIYSERWIMGEC